MKPRFYDSPDIENLGKRVFDFADLYDNIDPHIKNLQEYEEKYPFFRINHPGISYNGQIIDASIYYNVYLDSAWNGGSLHVGLNGGHNSMRILANKTKKSIEVEAQEKMLCDPVIGYNFIKEYFKAKGKIISDSIYKISIDVNGKEDILIFEDRDMKHTMFRGETGGYDPSYTGSLDVMNRGYMSRKGKWTAEGINALEKRINSLKILFDEISDIAQLTPVSKKIERKELIDYKMAYARLADSNYYRDILKFAKNISRKFNLENKYEIGATIDGTANSGICLQNEDKMTTLNLSFCKFDEYIGTFDLHIPRKYSKIKSFDKRINIYPKDGGYPLPVKELDKQEKIIQVTGFIKNIEEIPGIFDQCLEDLIGK